MIPADRPGPQARAPLGLYAGPSIHSDWPPVTEGVHAKMTGFALETRLPMT